MELLEEVIADRDRYRMLVEHVSDWIWEVDQNGIYTYASPQIKDILGYEPDEVIGKTPFDLMVPEEGEAIGPIFAHHVAHKLPISSLENRNLHKDGHEVILETSGSPILDTEGNCIGYRGIDRDITLRKQTERGQQRLLDIIEANPEFISTYHIEGQDYYYNPAARQLLGIKEGAENEWQKNAIWNSELVKTEGIPTAIDKGVWKGESILCDKEGNQIPISQIIVAHKSQNERVEVLSTIAHDISERKALEKVIHHQAHYDSLTNLPNRRMLDYKLTMLQNLTEDHKVAVLFIDLNNFKDINDNLDHEAGDYVLQAVANRLKSCAEETDFVCRYGGDEFLIILENKQLIEVEKQIEKIRAAFSKPIQVKENWLHITGSVGVSMYPEDGEDLTLLIKNADHSMYRVKRGLV